MAQNTAPKSSIPWPLVVVMVSWLLVLIELIWDTLSEPRVSRILFILMLIAVLWELWTRSRFGWWAVTLVAALALGMVTVQAIDSGSVPVGLLLFRWMLVAYQVCLLAALQAPQTLAWFNFASASRLRLIFWVTVVFVASGSAVLFASKSLGQ